MFWTDERVELLTRLKAEKRSLTQIAEAIGAGCTRNMVAGKTYRLRMFTPKRRRKRIKAAA